jgi:hypothetical protein
VVVVAHNPGGETGSEDVSVAAVAAVETLRVDAVEVLHARREAVGRRLKHEVVVRAHEAERVTVPLVAPNHEREQLEEVDPVGIVDEHQAAKDATRADLEDAVGQVGAPDTGHDDDRSRLSADGQARGRNDTKS